MLARQGLYCWIALAGLSCTGAEKDANAVWKNSGGDDGLRQAFEQVVYGIKDSGSGLYRGVNPAQRMGVEFNRDEARLKHGQGDFALRLTGYGYGNRRRTPLAANPVVSGNRVDYERGGIHEWYVNDSRGLEQGFTLGSRPGASRDGEPLVIALGLAGESRPELTPDGDAVLLRSSKGGVLRYAGLQAWDARGRALPSSLQVDKREVRLVVEDRNAEYPVVVDPIWSLQQELTNSSGAANDLFGISVSVSGDTALVGSYTKTIGANQQQGAAYVFVRSGTTWTQQQQLTASDGTAMDYFGVSVSVSGDTAVVGAYNKTIGANASQGAAYVFVRSGTTWSQQQQLLASDGAANNFFGVSVSVSGNTAVVGAYGKAVGGTVNQGAAYVFVRNVTSWSQQQELTAPDGAMNNNFGFSVAVNVDTAVIGAFGKAVGANQGQGAAYVFVRSGVTWTLQQELTASDGAAGDNFGGSVAVNGNTAVIGASGKTIASKTQQGAAYVFNRSGTSWTQQQELTSSDGAAHDFFGASVSVSGTTAVVGASGKTIGSNVQQGAAYVFGGPVTWTQQAELTAPDGGVADGFGAAVALDGTTALISAAAHMVGSNQHQGAAYVFVSQPGSIPGDFDGNGVPDVTLQFGDGSMGVWYLGGSGRQLSIIGFNFVAGASSGIKLVDVADVNGDGIPDLILRFTDGSIGVWYIGGAQRNAITGFAFISGPIAGWMPVGMADLNGDGHLDLIIQNMNDGSIGVWYLGGTQGNQIQGFAPIYGPLAGWKVVGMADLNNDTHPDMIIQYTDGTIGVWYLGGAQGSQIQGFAVIAGASPWSVVGSVDMDRDGHADLVIRHIDGTLGVWFLGGAQGNQITGFTPLTGAGGSNWLEMAAH